MESAVSFTPVSTPMKENEYIPLLIHGEIMSTPENSFRYSAYVIIAIKTVPDVIQLRISLRTGVIS